MDVTCLTPQEITLLTEFRQRLHANPEISGREEATAAQVRDFLRPTAPAQVIEGLGGAGLAVVYDSGQPGPRVMFRAELDALPIAEQAEQPHASRFPGMAHLCGHDGHMAILAGLGLWLARNPPRAGQVMLLFQPAEETGEGARGVLADPGFATLQPDWAFALHNMPGVELGTLAVAPGVASCASVGLRVTFRGREAHAAQPETGHSPAPALAALIAALVPYATPLPMGPEFRLATLCHLNMGAAAFGIAPAAAEVWITLRTYDDAGLDAFEAEVKSVIARVAQGLSPQITRHDHFHATVNANDAVDHVIRAQQAVGIAQGSFAIPMRPSEDFGAFSRKTCTALFFLGAGRDQPALHDPAYDFPDSLIAPGVTLFSQIQQQIQAG